MPAIVAAAVTPLLRGIIARHAVAAGMPPRQCCDRCATPIHPWRSPAFLPAARCPSCRHRLGAPPYLVEVATLAVITALAVAHRPVLQSLAMAWWIGCALPLGFIDAAVHRLPNPLTYLGAAGTITLLAVAADVEHNGQSLQRAVAAAVGGALVFAALTLALGRHGPGLGDAKLMLSSLAILGWFGWAAVVGGLWLAFIAQGIWAVQLLARRRANRGTQVPLGPFLIAATLAVVALLSV